MTLRKQIILLSIFVSTLLVSCQATKGSEEVCRDKGSSATVWSDLNSDGIKTDNEPPISDICVYARYTDRSDQSDEWYISQCNNHSPTHTSGFTDGAGTWLSYFMAGWCGAPGEAKKEMENQCKGIAISIVVPSGYKPTTPTTVIGCEASFGLVKKP